MDFFLGFLISVLSAAIAVTVNRVFSATSEPLPLKISQSRTFSLLSPNIIMIARDHSDKPRQSINHFNSIKVRMLTTETQAYWIKNNTVYVAEIENGIVLNETTKVVDIMGMDKVQLDEMMFIIEKLTEGNINDNWNPGN